MAAGLARKGTRRLLVAEMTGPVEAKVYDRAAMAPGFTFAGPAIVEQPDTTTLVEPGWHGMIDAGGSMILTFQDA